MSVATNEISRFSIPCTTWPPWDVGRRRWITSGSIAIGVCPRSSARFAGDWKNDTGRRRGRGSTSAFCSSSPSIPSLAFSKPFGSAPRRKHSTPIASSNTPSVCPNGMSGMGRCWKASITTTPSGRSRFAYPTSASSIDCFRKENVPMSDQPMLLLKTNLRQLRLTPTWST